MLNSFSQYNYPEYEGNIEEMATLKDQEFQEVIEMLIDFSPTYDWLYSSNLSKEEKLVMTDFLYSYLICLHLKSIPSSLRVSMTRERKSGGSLIHRPKPGWGVKFWQWSDLYFLCIYYLCEIEAHLGKKKVTQNIIASHITEKFSSFWHFLPDNIKPAAKIMFKPLVDDNGNAPINIEKRVSSGRSNLLANGYKEVYIMHAPSRNYILFTSEPLDFTKTKMKKKVYQQAKIAKNIEVYDPSKHKKKEHIENEFGNRLIGFSLEEQRLFRYPDRQTLQEIPNRKLKIRHLKKTGCAWPGGKNESYDLNYIKLHWETLCGIKPTESL